MKRAFDGFIKLLCSRPMECQEGHMTGVFSCLRSGIFPQVEKTKIRREKASSMLPLRLTEAWWHLNVCINRWQCLHPALSFHNPNQLRRMNHSAIIITVRFTSYLQRWRRNKWSCCYLLFPFPEGSLFKHILSQCLLFSLSFILFFLSLCLCSPFITLLFISVPLSTFLAASFFCTPTLSPK